MAKPKKVKLTPAQRQALEDGVRHGDVMHSVKGQAAHGGWTSTVRVLLRNGWIYPRTYEITDAGRAALASTH